MAKDIKFTRTQTDALLFDMVEPADLADKIEREFERFRGPCTPEDRSDHGFNFAVSAWHLIEWVYCFRKEAGDPRVAQFADMYKFRDAVIAACPAFEAMEDMTNASKHRQLTYQPVIVEARLSAMPMHDPAAHVDFDPFHGTNTARNSEGFAVRHKIEMKGGTEAFSVVARQIIDFIRSDRTLIDLPRRQKL